MRDDTYTEDFADIMSCSRERQLLFRIMQAWDVHGLPCDFNDSKVRPAFNRSSGNVFLVNEDFQVAMLRDGELESWYSCPYRGDEGFFEDLVREYHTLHPDDQEYLRCVVEVRGESIPGAEVTDATS